MKSAKFLHVSFHGISLALAVASLLVSLQLSEFAHCDRLYGVLHCCAFCCLVFVLRKYPAEMWAGSLASACLFSDSFVRHTTFYSFLVSQTAIWEAWCLYFGTLGRYFGILGASWATLRAAGRTRGIQGRIFIDFGMILEPHFDCFSDTDGF